MKRSRRARVPASAGRRRPSSGASTASLSTALAVAELLGSQRLRERCELRVVKRLACQRKRSISARGAKTYSPRWQRRTQRSTSASRRFLFKLSRRASSNAGHAHSCSQRSSARIGGRVRHEIAELVEFGVALLQTVEERARRRERADRVQPRATKAAWSVDAARPAAGAIRRARAHCRSQSPARCQPRSRRQGATRAARPA